MSADHYSRNSTVAPVSPESTSQGGKSTNKDSGKRDHLVSQFVLPQKHHEKLEFCKTRLPYRDSNHLKAVKVFTVSDESVFLLAHHVPALQLQLQLELLCQRFGEVESIQVLPDYPSEQFSEVVSVKFKRLASARLAKKNIDNYNFHGAVLHVHYAPELETVEETREKLDTRRREVAYRLWRNNKDLADSQQRKKDRYDKIIHASNANEPEPETVKKPIHGPRFNPFSS